MSMWAVRTAGGIGVWTMLWQSIGEDQGLLGEFKGLWQTMSHSRSVGLQGESDGTCLFAGLSVGSANQFGRGRHGQIRHWPVLTWVNQWGQVAKEEVHLYRAVAVGQHIFFTASAMWGKQHGGILFCWRVVGLGLWVRISTAD